LTKVGFGFRGEVKEAFTEWKKYVELNLAYYASPSSSLENQITDKYKGILDQSNQISLSSMNEEYDSWSTPRIGENRDEGTRLINEADQYCEKAGTLLKELA
jgi:hypothetical protein